MSAEPKSFIPRPPPSIAPYVEVLGVEDAIQFLLTFGGAEIYFTTTPKGRSRIAQVFGIEKATALAHAAEHMPRRIPTAKPWIAQVWNSQSLPQAEIARRLHVTDVTVRSFLKKAVLNDADGGSGDPSADPRQMRLL